MKAPGFMLAVQEAVECEDLFEQFLRLYKIKWNGPRTPIEAMIDEATGYDKKRKQENEAVFKQYVDFVEKYVWGPLSVETKIALSIEALQKYGLGQAPTQPKE